MDIFHDRQNVLDEPQQPGAPAARVSGWGQQKYRLTILFSITALVVIAIAATIANHVIGGLAESDLIRLAERNTFRDASHIQSMMRGQHSMIGMAQLESMKANPTMANMDQPMANMDQPMAKMDQPMANMDQPMANMDQPMANMDQPMANMDQPMANMDQPMANMDQPMANMDQPMDMSQVPLTLAVLAGPTGLPAHFPMLVEGLAIVKANLLDLEGRTIWSTNSVSIGITKAEKSLFQEAASGQAASKLLRDLQVIHLDGVSRKIDVVDTYAPLRETAGGPVIGVLELFKDVTADVSVQVDEAKSTVLWTTVATMAGLFAVLFGFIFVADGAIIRGYRRGVELVEEANRTLEARVIGRTAELATSNEDLKREIDERQRIEDELVAARDIALEAAHAKSEFLASMSHEIRTPLNAIIGMAELLSETQLDESQQDYVQMFQTAGDTLLDTINDILDISKLEAGQLSLEGIEFDLRELVDNTARVLAVRAREKGLELNCSIAPDVATALVGDPSRLGPVITNLLGNAIKFTDSGEVALHVENDPEANEDGVLRFTVTDSGIGIPPEKLEAIFESFVQGDSSTTREYGGTGLGLTISRRLVELMGGKVWVESEVGKGSKFCFTACFELQTGAKVGLAGDPAELAGRKVLIVDDHDTNREFVQAMVAAWGASTVEASNGYQALAELDAAGKNSEPFDLLILDQRMPGMDGLEVATLIHKDQRLACTVIMMLAPDAGADEISRFQDLGITCCLTRPVEQSELLQAIRTTNDPVNGTAEDLSSANGVATLEDRSLSILLVDDALANRKLVQAYLKATPHRVDIAENGEVAVRKFVSGNYDLVLMDMQMPVMDGYTATKAIRKWQTGIGISPTPIVALTAYALREEVQKCLDVGCTAHLAKPIKKALLLDTIHQYG